VKGSSPVWWRASSPTESSLSGAPAHLHRLVARLGFGPVVLVGQSLGGAVATLFAREHPEDVAGLVLLDPRPINDATLCARTETPAALIGKLAGLPVVGAGVSAAIRAAVLRQARSLRLRPDCAAAMERGSTSASWDVRCGDSGSSRQA
jgi:pimeloyl-ACP methyl ester carboxylesterase